MSLWRVRVTAVKFQCFSRSFLHHYYCCLLSFRLVFIWSFYFIFVLFVLFFAFFVCCFACQIYHVAKILDSQTNLKAAQVLCSLQQDKRLFVFYRLRIVETQFCVNQCLRI